MRKSQVIRFTWGVKLVYPPCLRFKQWIQIIMNPSHKASTEGNWVKHSAHRPYKGKWFLLTAHSGYFNQIPVDVSYLHILICVSIANIDRRAVEEI